MFFYVLLLMLSSYNCISASEFQENIGDTIENSVILESHSFLGEGDADEARLVREFLKKTHFATSEQIAECNKGIAKRLDRLSRRIDSLPSLTNRAHKKEEELMQRLDLHLLMQEQAYVFGRIQNNANIKEELDEMNENSDYIPEFDVFHSLTASAPSPCNKILGQLNVKNDRQSKDSSQILSI